MWSNVGQIIYGTKCDRDKPIFSTEQSGQYVRAGHKREPIEIEKCKQEGQSQGSFLPLWLLYNGLASWKPCGVMWGLPRPLHSEVMSLIKWGYINESEVIWSELGSEVQYRG